MSTQRQNPEEMFERAVAAARDQAIDPQVVAAARERVARRVAAEVDGAANVTSEVTVVPEKARKSKTS